MSRRPSLLYVSRGQFGYNLPTYNNVRFLRDYFDVTMLTIDQGQSLIELEQVNSFLVRGANKFARYGRLQRTAISMARTGFALVLVEHFPGCSAIPLLGREGPFVVDVRTGAIHQHSIERLTYDAAIKWDVRWFDGRSVISDALRLRLGGKLRDSVVIPLGADVRISKNRPPIDTLSLLYVGTLQRRKVHESVWGVYHAIQRGIAKIAAFHIVGSGGVDDINQLMAAIRDTGLQGIVHVHGFIHHNELAPIYEQTNVGVSYLPITPFFDAQPVTKTYEYLLAGMPVIASATAENRLTVTPDRGELTLDNPEAFAVALGRLYARRNEFDANRLRDSMASFTWKRIIDDTMAPFLKQVLEQHRRKRGSIG